MVFDQLPSATTRVALEITAGQGTCLGCRFEHLATLLKGCSRPERLCVCFDTAHAFAAGYDLSSEQSTEKVFEEFDSVIGLQHLVALHLNDSKAACGSRVDRHDHIGSGKIGLPAFRYIMNAPSLAALPKVLETPKEKEMREDVENMERLRALIGTDATP
jgi:deoxyribonuclease-4